MDIKDVYISPHTSPGILANKYRKKLGIPRSELYGESKGGTAHDFMTYAMKV